MYTATLPTVGATITGIGLDGRTYTGRVVMAAELLRLVVIEVGYRRNVTICFD